jgi:hypothetical protein
MKALDLICDGARWAMWLMPRVSTQAELGPDDLMITIYEAPGVNFSFGRGEAQRANAVPQS